MITLMAYRDVYFNSAAYNKSCNMVDFLERLPNMRVTREDTPIPQCNSFILIKATLTCKQASFALHCGIGNCWLIL